MIRGLYTSAAGMLTGLRRHETIVHNLSNVRTIGYKADRATLEDFPSLLLTEVRGGRTRSEVGRAGTGVSLADLKTDFSSGPLKLTDNPLDFAIAEEGFFRIQTEDGVRYTRDGRFHRDVDGRLITANGYYVLGENGPINLPQGALTVTPQGQIFVNDTQIDQLTLAQFADNDNIIKDSQTTFAARDAEPELMQLQDIQIYQGYLEESNLDSAQAITEMMSVLRAYQASQRFVQFQDQINDQAANELGRV
ncbi:MAG: flagellar hook-basal body protein [Anaerolineae bacterium]|nr:flagellar hook-basal body protein [Anaerolineae bacterium]